MTTKNSICARCNNLKTYGVCTPSNMEERCLISFCNGSASGANLGNRKQCSRFEEASPETVEERLKELEDKNNGKD